MKIFLFSVLILCCVEGRTQEISCPKFYPWEDTVLAEVPYQHTGKGIIRKQELTGANWMAGDFNDTNGEMVGDIKKGKGGVDIAVPDFAKWFVCTYGGGVSWWEELKPSIAKANCTIQIRNKVGRDPMDAKLVCKGHR